MTPADDQPCNLAGLSVLVTRPADQALPLVEAIQQAHGRPIRFPTIEIQGPADKQQVIDRLSELNTVDLVIFVSANAVRYAFPLMPDDIPLNLQIAAVGSATARALAAVGLDATLVPATRLDSEGLLALPELQHMDNRRVLIVRGDGGRETLRETLGARGASVDYVEVYRRRLPKRNTANLIGGWAQMVDVVVATSNNVLDNLFTLLGGEGAALLTSTPLVVVSKRMAEHAAARGCSEIFVARSALDNDLLAALCDVNDAIP